MKYDISTKREAVTSFTGDHAFLSNFYESPFRMEGVADWWNTAEHAYQAAKCQTAEDYRSILTARTPATAKRLGRTVRMADPEQWRARRKEIMLRVLMAKFEIPALREQLDATGDALLVEGNTWGDIFWGAVPNGERGWSSRLPRFTMTDGEDLAGHNWLGTLLMVVRDVRRP